MSMEQQAEASQQAYTSYHKMLTQPWRTAEDRTEALTTLKDELTGTEQTLRLPSAEETPRARSQLMLWAEMVKGTLREVERGQR
jgi:hypothetical protein